MHRFKKLLLKTRYPLLFSAWSVLGWLTPYVLDDWYWGTVQYVFPASDNGRYAGHLFSLLLTRSRSVRMLVFAAAMTGIVYGIERMTKRRSAFFLASLSLLLLPKNVFRQAVAWTSGFANYTVSIPFFLCFALYVAQHPDGRSRRRSAPMLLLLLGVINSLFVEHYTVLNIGASVGVLVFYSFKKVVRIDYIGYCAGSFLGAAAMFSNNVYRNVLNHTDTYRAIAYGGFFNRIWKNYSESFLRDFCLGSLFVNAVLLFACLVLFWKPPAGKPFAGRRRGVLLVCMTVMYGFCLLSLLSRLYYNDIIMLPKNDRLFWGVLSFASLACSVIASLLLSRGDGPDLFLLSMWASLFTLIAPLFPVYPIGGRCFMGPYVVLVIIACHLAAGIPSEIWGARVRNAAAVCGVAAMALLFAGYDYVMGVNDAADAARRASALAQAEKGSKTVTISHLPYEDYLWWPTPYNEGWNSLYIKFYGLPEDIVLTIEKNGGA